MIQALACGDAVWLGGLYLVVLAPEIKEISKLKSILKGDEHGIESKDSRSYRPHAT